MVQVERDLDMKYDTIESVSAHSPVENSEEVNKEVDVDCRASFKGRWLGESFVGNPILIKIMIKFKIRF